MNINSYLATRIASVLVVLTAPLAFGFDIDVDRPVHQDITRTAILEVNRSLNLSMNPQAIKDIEIGNVHTDDLLGPHKTAPDQADLHFNNGHVLSNNGRDQFDRSFLAVRRFITRAAELSEANSRVLSPNYPTSTQIYSRTSGLCKERQYKDHCRITRIRSLTLLPLNYSHDPHVRKAKRLLDLREELKPLLRAMRRNNDSRDLRVRNIILEINAYEARQLLGHAFHTLQDFFSHSNFIELANRESGPPCALRFGRDERCGDAIPGEPQRFGDPALAPIFAVLAEGFRFNRSTISNAVSDTTLRPLQTGYVKLNVRVFDNRHVFCQPNKVPTEFDYCHWRGNEHPELNKDKPGDEDVSHASHRYAKATAQYVSEMMWLSYLRQSGRYPQPALRWQQRVTEGTVNANRSGRYQILPDRQVRLTIPNALALDSPYSYSIENSEGASAAQGGSSCSNGVDFIERLGQGVFRRGATHSMIPVTLCPDSQVEVGGENFLVKIQSAVLEEDTRSILIRDDDNHPTPTLSGLGTTKQGMLITPGTSILVTGQNFRPISRIDFQGQQLRPRYITDKLLSFSIPSATQPGRYDVSVTTATGGRSAVKRLGIAGPSTLSNPDLSTKIQRPKMQKPELEKQPRTLLRKLPSTPKAPDRKPNRSAPTKPKLETRN